MTGFGTGRASDGERVLVVEVRSVNSKSCDVRTRLPRELTALEPRVGAALRHRISRGRLDVSIDLAHAPESTLEPKIDLPLAKGYLRALERLKDELGLSSSITLEMILSAPGVIAAPDAAADLDRNGELVDRALALALEQLDAMRGKEGAALSAELLRIRGEITACLTQIRAEVPVSIAQRRARLEGRLSELLEGQSVEPLRVAQEIALLVDRSDVTEELARLESHLVQFGELLHSGEPVGRKLDFLLQEMHREANTLGAKSSSARISHLVVELKSALERLREQVQNVE